MLVQKEILEQVRHFGLNSYESRLWTALLAKGAATAGELSDMANVPRSRAYDVLESLERKGFIMLKVGKPIKYIAVSPDAVLDRVKKRIAEEADEKRGSLDKLRKTDLLAELNMLYKNGIDVVEPFELAASIKGRKAIYNHLEGLIRNSGKSINIMTSQAGIVRKKDSFMKLLKKAKDRGVKVRIAAPIAGQESARAASELKSVAEVYDCQGAARFCTVDSSDTVFMIFDDTEVNPLYDSAISVTSPFLASSFEKMFASYTRKNGK